MPRRLLSCAFRVVLGLALCVAAPATAETDPPGTTLPSHESDFDPWEGIDRDGRIPRVELPDDLPNPDQWRYIPEGRIKPGNLFQRFLVSSMIAPFVFHDSDVGTGFGVTLVDIDFRQQRRREFSGLFVSYTTEGQQNYSFVWRRWLHHRELPSGGVLQEEKSFLRAAGGYSRTLTRRFFGVGPKTRERDETSYRDELFFLDLGLERAWPDPGDELVLSFGVRGEAHSLGQGAVSDEPDTKNVFPAIFDDADDARLGWVYGGVRWDTRDSQRNPYRGWTLGATLDAALLQDDSDVGAIFGVNGSRIFPLAPLLHDGGDGQEEHPPTDTLAFGLVTRATTGNLPFFVLPTLGGADTHRGFVVGRWRDEASWHASAEYRFWILPRGFAVPFTDAVRVERLGAALFYDVGAVARRADRIFGSRVRSSAGIGLRISLERAAPFRVDVGFSEDGVNFAARFGLSF
jgi:hypothetical protein